MYAKRVQRYKIKNQHTVDAKEVRLLKSLEAEKVVAIVTVINDGRVKTVGVLHDDLVGLLGDERDVAFEGRVDVGIEVLDDGREDLLGLLVEVGDGDAGSEGSIIRVVGSQVGGGLGSQVVELDCSDTLVHALHDLHIAQLFEE